MQHAVLYHIRPALEWSVSILVYVLLSPRLFIAGVSSSIGCQSQRARLEK